MNATGFVYDGMSTESLNIVICQFDSSGGIEITSAGSELNWNTVPVRHGNIYLTTNTTYDSVLESTFQICKYDCSVGVLPLTFEEQREISRWLNRKEPHLLTLIGDDPAFQHIGFEGSFNLSKIKINGEIMGYELHFISNRPYAIGRLIRKTIKATTNNFVYRFYDDSDEVGYIYPQKMTVKCSSSGTLTIHNSIEDKTLKIDNCTDGEIITFDKSLNIFTSLKSHETTLPNDFNYSYFRIANSYYDKLNILTISIPCEITIEYYPIVKGVGL